MMVWTVWRWFSSNLRLLVGLSRPSRSLFLQRLFNTVAWFPDHDFLLWLGLKVRNRETLLFADVLKSRQEMTSEMLHINVQIALLNGHAYELRSLSLSSSVRALRMAAQRAFGQKHLRLITGEKRVLVNSEQTLEEAQIKDGECLTVLVLQPHLAATVGAFALWCHGDSTIVTWGSREFGGDSSAVQDQLRGLQQIQATGGAPPPASCTSTCSAPPGPCADKSTGCEGEENLQGILWPPASRRARRPRALCWQ